MERLERIQIAGFKSIKDQTVDLGALNVLVGANGAGKSNFIEVFRLAGEIARENLAVFVGQSGGADRLLHFGRKTTEEILIHFQYRESAWQCRLIPAQGDTLFEKERVSTQPALCALQTARSYHFQDTSASARMKQTGDIDDNAELRPDGGNLAPFLYRLQRTAPEAFRSIVDTVRLVAPFFGDFNLRPDRLNTSKIKLEWLEQGSDSYFDADSLSDGTLRFLCLATLLLQPEPPPLILIDEPELGLHPYAINVLAGLLRSAAERSQLIISTQSVTLINQLSPEDVIVVDREEHASVFRRLSSADLESWLDGYALGELWEKNVIGGRPNP